MRLIDADALEKRMEERLTALRKEYGNYDHYTDGFEEGCVAVEDAETIDPESLRPKGEWLWYDLTLSQRYINRGYRCSVCGFEQEDESNFCPNCGCSMEVNNGRD